VPTKDGFGYLLDGFLLCPELRSNQAIVFLDAAMCFNASRALDELESVASREIAIANESLQLQRGIGLQNETGSFRRVLPVHGHLDHRPAGVEVLEQDGVLAAEWKRYEVAGFSEDFSVDFHGTDKVALKHHGVPFRLSDDKPTV
jgi:hypothetical protein